MRSTVDQMHTHLAKHCTFGQMLCVSSIDQMLTALRIWADVQRIWENGLRICRNAQIGQICLTVILEIT